MKKIILAIVIGLGVAGTVIFASDFPKIHVNSWAMDIDVIPSYTVKKFIDGNVACYTFQNQSGNGISCVKFK